MVVNTPPPRAGSRRCRASPPPRRPGADQPTSRSSSGTCGHVDSGWCARRSARTSALTPMIRPDPSSHAAITHQGNVGGGHWGGKESSTPAMKGPSQTGSPSLATNPATTTATANSVHPSANPRPGMPDRGVPTGLTVRRRALRCAGSSCLRCGRARPAPVGRSSNTERQWRTRAGTIGVFAHPLPSVGICPL